MLGLRSRPQTVANRSAFGELSCAAASGSQHCSPEGSLLPVRVLLVSSEMPALRTPGSPLSTQEGLVQARTPGAALARELWAACRDRTWARGACKCGGAVSSGRLLTSRQP
uniref:Uncharacterized protein n=1 Tax=Rangifer tarandus platyrhynchus TaxID=3082113 RepID=A0ACB0F3K9_RANTA|nr:unnamed protein product [Rangifer tarandus platyrhynchus]